MIDIKLFRTDPELVKKSETLRGNDPKIVDEIIELDKEVRDLKTKSEELKADLNKKSKSIATLPNGDEKLAILAETKELSKTSKEAAAKTTQLEETLNELLYKVQNITTEAPEGGEDDYIVVKEIGNNDLAKNNTDTIRDHLEIGEKIDAIDSERGVKVSGSRFYYLKGIGARLELALLNFAMDTALKNGFIPMITPTLVRPEIMKGTGFLGAHADEIYRLREPDEAYLVGTSEVALAGYHSDEIIELDSEKPLRYAGWSSCFRREAGSYGKDTRGIIRVHQFNKIEMFSYVAPEYAETEHKNLLALEEQILTELGLPYRVIDTAAGDLGSSAARKFDCEAWLPSQNRYLELTSTSNCTTFQARRLNIRYRPAQGDNDKTTTPVATLNGTLATTRFLVAILENFQTADGGITVPKPLQKYLDGLEVIEPTK
ncbi:MAG: serine--tRNA ligase [Bifidobacteriaceae bacterium]|jgi:seryl-tRNA synthetase|nr:serine--tRNA ligase [Bifidobacteriaceae bacterium]